MIKIAKIQFCPWCSTYDFHTDSLKVNINDKVLIKTELGEEIGQIIEINDANEADYFLTDENGEAHDSNQNDASKNKQALKPIIRLANNSDLKTLADLEQKKEAILKDAEKIVKKTGLQMKLADLHISFDDTKITFAFIAGTRIDFRDLVKEMSHHFHKTIRLQQLGARDEAKIKGDMGPCGRDLCCKTFLTKLGGVNSDLVSTQQIDHRGSDRLSGSCGRLMCCLRYENDSYVELAKKMPAIGSRMKTEKGEGVVVGWHTLKQTVDVKVGMDRNSVIEVEIAK
jgi:cell fate regulator YaaT (PSP1 superfamily)